MNKILFVDDMPEVYAKLRSPTNMDYVNNFEDAKSVLYFKRYNLLITDFHLGKEAPKGGLELIKIAKSIGIEAILISTENHEEEALEAGADKFIFKKEFIEGTWKGLNLTRLINLND